MLILFPKIAWFSKFVDQLNQLIFINHCLPKLHIKVFDSLKLVDCVTPPYQSIKLGEGRIFVAKVVSSGWDKGMLLDVFRLPFLVLNNTRCFWCFRKLGALLVLKDRHGLVLTQVFGGGEYEENGQTCKQYAFGWKELKFKTWSISKKHIKYKSSKRKQVEKHETHLIFTMYFNKHLSIHSINTPPKKNNLHHLQHNLYHGSPFHLGTGTGLDKPFWEQLSSKLQHPSPRCTWETVY